MMICIPSLLILKGLVDTATIMSPLIGIAAIVVAVRTLKSSSEDSQKHIQKVNMLIISIIDNTITELTIECKHFENEKNKIKLQKKEWESDPTHAMSSFNSVVHFGSNPYEDAIESNDRAISALKKRMEEMNKLKSKFLQEI